MTVLKGAQKAGVSVCDYLESLWGHPGSTQMLIDRMAELGAVGPDVKSVCEIGPGSGRYLGKVLLLINAARYECYEVQEDWAKWLKSTYPVTCHPSDGYSLAHTISGSVDLVHAHGVFVTLDFLTTYVYLKEMARVASPRSWLFFDIFSENCFDDDVVSAWLEAGILYPRFLSRQYVVGFLSTHDFSLVDSFMWPYGKGRSEYLAFQKNT